MSGYLEPSGKGNSPEIWGCVFLLLSTISMTNLDVTGLIKVRCHSWFQMHAHRFQFYLQHSFWQYHTFSPLLVVFYMLWGEPKSFWKRQWNSSFNIGNDGLTGALNFKWPEGCCCPKVLLVHPTLSTTNPFYQATLGEINGVNFPFKWWFRNYEVYVMLIDNMWSWSWLVKWTCN